MVLLDHRAQHGVRLHDLFLRGEIVLHVGRVDRVRALSAQTLSWRLAIDIDHRRRLVERGQSLENDDCGNYRKNYKSQQLPAVTLDDPKILRKRWAIERRIPLHRRKKNT